MDKNNIKKLEQDIEEARKSLSTNRMDMSFGEIMSMYEREEIIIDPAFQRLFRWSNYQQTRFIESLLLRIPIPPVFVAENKDGKWELVDGLQRLSTVFSFFGILKGVLDDKNNWSLCKGELVKSLENFSHDDLPLKLRLNIRTSVCRIEVIEENNSYDMKYELFNRLNTGGSSLTDQEIRNCIFRGISSEFNDFLNRLSSSEDFVELISPTEKQVSELYPDELVLRFCSLVNNSKNITTALSQHMTEYMRIVVRRPEIIPELETLFNKVISLLKPIGKSAFRSKSNLFSTSLYDGVTVGIAQNIKLYENAKTAQIEAKINQLKDDDDFKKASGSLSNSKNRTRNRLEAAQKVFATLSTN